MKTERIICDPKILGGKPIIKGTRISVSLILTHFPHKTGYKNSFPEDNKKYTPSLSSLQLQAI